MAVCQENHCTSIYIDRRKVISQWVSLACAQHLLNGTVHQPIICALLFQEQQCRQLGFPVESPIVGGTAVINVLLSCNCRELFPTIVKCYASVCERIHSATDLHTASSSGVDVQIDDDIFDATVQLMAEGFLKMPSQQITFDTQRVAADAGALVAIVNSFVSQPWKQWLYLAVPGLCKVGATYAVAVLACLVVVGLDLGFGDPRGTGLQHMQCQQWRISNSRVCISFHRSVQPQLVLLASLKDSTLHAHSMTLNTSSSTYMLVGAGQWS